MILLGLACWSPALADGLPAEMATELEGCNALSSPHRDACALEVLERMGNMPGTSMHLVCTRMRDPSSKDRCLELAVRAPNDPADVSACEDIEDELLGYSCVLAEADRRMDGDLDEALDMCQRTGPLVRHCATHFGTHRLDAWSAAGADVMTEEVAMLIALWPDLAVDADFGYSIGYAAYQIGILPGGPGPCDAFEYGDGKMACETAMLSPRHAERNAMKQQMGGGPPPGQPGGQRR